MTEDSPTGTMSVKLEAKRDFKVNVKLGVRKGIVQGESYNGLDTSGMRGWHQAMTSRE